MASLGYHGQHRGGGRRRMAGYVSAALWAAVILVLTGLGWWTFNAVTRTGAMPPPSATAESLRPEPVKTTAPATVSAVASARVYVVKQGDTLQGISLAEYGTTDGWQAIYQANKAAIDRQGGVILPGERLVLPIR